MKIMLSKGTKGKATVLPTGKTVKINKEGTHNQRQKILEERSEIPIVLLFLLCCRLLPKLGETAKVYR